MVLQPIGQNAQVLRLTTAYQGIREAMADHPRGFGGHAPHLDTSGPRDVVFCHQCEHEWYQDEAGPYVLDKVILVPNANLTLPPTRHEIRSRLIPIQRKQILRSLLHMDQEVLYYSPEQSEPQVLDLYSECPRGEGDPHDEDLDFVMRDFHNILGSIMGPQFRLGQAGRSGANTLFTQDNGFGGQTSRVGGDGNGPTIVGGRFAFGGPPPRQPRGADFHGNQQPGGPPPVPDLATYDPPSHPLNGRSLHIVSIRAPPDQFGRIIRSLFAPMGPPGQRDGPHAGGLPPGLQSLFAAMANPANARSGDGVYTQQALDQIISTLMKQQPNF
ncbi:hypothetical protein DL95DRAFT_471933 [Leptodontidium sp. 2 PMI_412]|nr:hypothetical protein DL95DRAFT_471933 [Leptodontidium sp. 2 PMI_412]